MDDWLQLEKYSRTGDSDAFSTLVHRHLGLVYATALRITGDPAAADDVSQAVFILLEEKADRLKPAGSLASWLYQTAVFKARKQVAKDRTRRHKEAKGAEAMITIQAESAENEWNEIRPLIDTALESLGEEDRVIIISRHLQQMPLKEVGAALGISEDAAAKRVARAGNRLRDWFESHGIRCTGDVLGGALGSFAMVAPPAHLLDQVMSSALGASAGATTAHATGEAVSNWLSSRTAMVAVFAMAVVSPVAVSVIHPGGQDEAGLATAEESKNGGVGATTPLTADEAEWMAIWKNHAPPHGGYRELMAAILKINDPLKRQVFEAVAYSEWADKGLPVPAELDCFKASPLFEQLLAKDPARAAGMAASFNRKDAIPKYLAVSSKLASLAVKAPQGLAEFIKLVEIPSKLNSEYPQGSWQKLPTALPPQADGERAGHIRDAVALLAEKDPALAEATVDSLTGWHREQALAGLLAGRAGTDLAASIRVLSERSEAPAMKENVLQFLLTKWIGIDPRQAITALDELQKGNGAMRAVPSGKLASSRMRSELFGAYAERDFDGCMTLLGEVGTKADVGERFCQVVAARIRENPVPTLDAMEKLASRLKTTRPENWTYLTGKEMAPVIWEWCARRQSNNYVKSLASTVLAANAYADPEFAIELYLRNPDLAAEFPTSSFSQVFSRYTVDDAKRILARFPEKERNNTIYSMLRSRNLEWDVSDCLALYENLPENRRDQSAEGVASRIAESDPEAAVAWALSQPEERIRNSSVSGLIASWADFDPVSASEWADQLEPGGMRDTAASQLADKLSAQGDYESAIAWASGIADQKSSPGVKTDILLRAAKTESGEALEALIEQSGLSDNERKSLYEKIASDP